MVEAGVFVKRNHPPIAGVSDPRVLLRDAIYHGMTRLRVNYQRKLKDGGSIATGELRRSVVIGVEEQGRDDVGWLSFEPYWKQLDEGVPPGTLVPLHTEEGGGLVRWVKAKHLADTVDAEGKRHVERFRAKKVKGKTVAERFGYTKRMFAIAASVQRAIKKYGTKPRFYLADAIREEWPRIVASLDKLLE